MADIFTSRETYLSNTHLLPLKGLISNSSDTHQTQMISPCCPSTLHWAIHLDRKLSSPDKKKMFLSLSLVNSSLSFKRDMGRWPFIQLIFQVVYCPHNHMPKDILGYKNRPIVSCMFLLIDFSFFFISIPIWYKYIHKTTEVWYFNIIQQHSNCKSMNFKRWKFFGKHINYCSSGWSWMLLAWLDVPIISLC